MSSFPRIPPLPVEHWPPEAHEAYGVLRSQATQALGGSSNMTMTLANHPKLEKAFYTFGRHLLLDSTVPDRLRELATLRVAVQQHCDYEWCHHVRFGLRIGLTDAEIEAVKQGPEAAVWSAADRAVLRAVDQLCRTNRLDDAGWTDLAAHLDRWQVMDLVFTIGQYAMLGWAGRSRPSACRSSGGSSSRIIRWIEPPQRTARRPNGQLRHFYIVP